MSPPIDVSVVVATFGDRRIWDPLAERAAASVPDDVPLIREHRDDGTLAEVRNAAVARAATTWIAVLDADDELEPGYFEAMAQADTDVRAPLVRYVTSRFSKARARVPAGTDDLAQGNNLVIGCVFRKTLFDEVGGFRDWPFWEDFDFWQRCWLAGATIGRTDAVYRAHVRRGSRNRSPRSAAAKLANWHAIRRANMPWLYDATEGEGVGA